MSEIAGLRGQIERKADVIHELIQEKKALRARNAELEKEHEAVIRKIEGMKLETGLMYGAYNALETVLKFWRDLKKAADAVREADKQNKR